MKFIGDSGSGGTPGLVPVAAAGDAAAGKFLKADGTWTAPAVLTVASQSDQETATSTTAAVTPSNQQFHPSAAKCWAYVTYSAGVPTLQASYNITSITDDALGKLTITIATDFSSANWASVALGTDNAYATVNTKAAGSIAIWFKTGPTNALVDPTEVSFVGFGDQ